MFMLCLCIQKCVGWYDASISKALSCVSFWKPCCMALHHTHFQYNIIVVLSPMHPCSCSVCGVMYFHIQHISCDRFLKFCLILVLYCYSTSFQHTLLQFFWACTYITVVSTMHLHPCSVCAWVCVHARVCVFLDNMFQFPRHI